MKKSTMILAVAMAAVSITACGASEKAELASEATELASEAAEIVSEAVSEGMEKDPQVAAEMEIYEAVIGKIFLDEYDNEWKFNADNTFVGTADGDPLEGTYDVNADDKGTHLTITIDGEAVDEGIITVEGDKIVVTLPNGDKQILTETDQDLMAVYKAILGKKFVDEYNNQWIFNEDKTFQGTVEGDDAEGVFAVKPGDKGVHLSIILDGEAVDEGYVTFDGDKIVLNQADETKQVLTEVK